MEDFQKELELLNPRQLSAVVTNNVPLRIIAGAGSGKTRVITMKIAYLVKEMKIPSWKILAVTFTNKAAREMKERVINLLGDASIANPRISTFHSFCYRLLREDGEAIGLRPNFSIIDTNDQKTMLKRIMKDLNIDQKHYPRAESRCLSAIDDWKNNFVTMTDAYNEAGTDEYKDYARVWEKYEKLMEKNNYVDFNDLQIKTYHILSNNFEIRDKWRDRFDYVLVDEFQDTNELQFDIIKFLTKDKNNLTVVGDPDQTIYSWRGAKISIILNFKKIYKNAETIVLNENYRSTKQIIALADDFIDNNVNREKKDVVAKSSGPQVIVHESTTQKNEANYIAEKIKELVDEGTYNYRDFFILYRVNAWSRELEHAMGLYKIPYQLIGGIRFRERKVIKDAIAFLKAVSLKDNISLERVLNSIPKVGAVTVGKLLNWASISDMSLYEVLTSDKDQLLTVSKHLSKIHDILIQGNEMFENNTPPQDIVKFELEESGYLEKLKLVSKNEEDEQNLNALFDQLTDFTNNFDSKVYDEENVTLAFLQEEALGIDDAEQTPNMVTLLTIHASKGLENKVVFVAGLSAGVFPSKRSMFNANDLEEERRALYVAMTRAEQRLFITYVHGEYSFITGGELSPSKFIKELNKDYYKDEKSISAPLFSNGQHNESTNPWTKEETYTSDIKQGDLVNHVFFGDGVVIKIIKNQLQIAFNNPTYGVRVIPINNSAISKIEDK